MTINLILKAHQPYRIKKFRVFDIGKEHESYFDQTGESDLNNERMFRKAADRYYLPVNRILQKFLDENQELKINLSISGVFLEQAREFDEDVVKSFQKLIETGRVEILGETYYHSLALLYSEKEFEEQVLKHKKLVKDIFDKDTKVFINYDINYSDTLVEKIKSLGFTKLITRPFGKSIDTNIIYKTDTNSDFKIYFTDQKLKRKLLKIYETDDIDEQISLDQADAKSTTQTKLIEIKNILNKLAKDERSFSTLVLDYEELDREFWQNDDASLIENLLSVFSEEDNLNSINLSEDTDIVQTNNLQELAKDVEAPTNDDFSNRMQKEAMLKLYKLSSKLDQNNNEELWETWRRMQSSDHFYYMSTNNSVVSTMPYESPYDAFISFVNALEDLEETLNVQKRKPKEIIIA